MSLVQHLARLWRNPWFSWSVRLGVTTALLGALLVQIDLGELFHTFIQFDPIIFALLVIIWLFSLFIQAYQRWLLLRPLAMHFSVWELFRINLAMGFYSLVLPSNMAGGVGWYKLARPGGKVIEAGLLIFFSRIIQVLLLLMIALAIVWGDPHLRSSLFGVLVVAMLGGTIVVLLPFFSPTTTRSMLRLIRFTLKHLPLPVGIRDRGRMAWQSMLAFQHLPLPTIALVLAISLLVHVLGGGRMMLAALAVGIHQPIFILGWAYVMLYVLALIPISIAGLGVREVSLVMLLSSYGTPEGQALSMSLVLFGSSVLVGLVGGLVEGWEVWFRTGRSQPATIPDGSEVPTVVAHSDNPQ